MQNSNKVNFSGILLFIFSFLFMARYSILNSCHLPAISRGADAQVFATIGYSWLNGLVPYKDLFDHKGPFLYLLNSLGFIVANGNELGIFIIESLFYLFFVFLVFKIFESKLTACIAVCIISLSILNVAYEGGNLTESYAMLFSLFSIYCYLKRQYHKYTILFLIGICGAANFLLRANLAVTPFLMFLFILFEDKISTKNILCKLKEIICCGLGFIIFLSPFIFYFLYKDSFYDFYESYIKFNFLYMNTGRNISSVIGTFLKIKYFVLFYFLILIYTVYIKKYVHATLGIFLFLSSLLFGILLSMRGYAHYFLILIPPFLFSAYVISDTLNKIYQDLDKKISYFNHNRHKFIVYNIIVIILIIAYFPFHFQDLLSKNNINNEREKLYKLGINNNSSILVDRHYLTAVYHLTNSTPKNRIFFETSLIKRNESDIEKAFSDFDFVILGKKRDIPSFKLCGRFRGGYVYRNINIDNDTILLEGQDLEYQFDESLFDDHIFVNVDGINAKIKYATKSKILMIEPQKTLDSGIVLFLKPKNTNPKEGIRKILRYILDADSLPKIATRAEIGMLYKPLEIDVFNVPIVPPFAINGLVDLKYVGLKKKSGETLFHRVK